MTIKLQNYATVVFFDSTNISASFMTTVTQKNVFIISLSYVRLFQASIITILFFVKKLQHVNFIGQDLLIRLL